MWRALSKQSSIKVSQCLAWRLTNSKRGSLKRNKSRKRRFWTHFIMMSIASKKPRTPKMRILQMLCALISSKDFAKKERNAFTLMTSPLTAHKKSIYMWIKGHNLSWMLLGANSWAHYQKNNSESILARRKKKWLKVVDLILSANSF